MGINSFFKDLFDFTNRNLPVLEENIIFEVPDKVVAPLPDLEGIALDIYNSLTTRYMEPRGDVCSRNLSKGNVSLIAMQRHWSRLQ